MQIETFNQERDDVSELIENIHIPKMFKVQQIFSNKHIERKNIKTVLMKLLENDEIASRIKPGMNIAITASSRGIANADIILKSIVDFVKQRQAYPFIVPAMGSHGGATAEGQLEILKNYGITPETMDCPIYSSMETVKIGVNEEGKDVYIDKYAAEADGIIVNCRVKPHTAFRGPYESGIMKMMTIGLGKQYGADICHSEGFENMAKNIPLFGKCILKNSPVLFAVATIDNAFEKTYKLCVVPAEKIEEEEPKLLRQAFECMARIWVDTCDVLIVDEIGKNISGDGMDPNITGTFATKYAHGGIKAQRVAVLRISKESHGNGMGIGYADATTTSVLQNLNLSAMYLNAITSTTIQGVSLPIVMKNDKETIQVCLKCCTGINRDSPRIVRISNTLDLEHIWLSEAYWNEVQQMDQIIIKSKLETLNFDSNGNLCNNN